MQHNKRTMKAIAAVMVATWLIAMAACAPLPQPVEDVFPRAQCDVYMEQGCAKMIVDDGGEIEVLSGGALDLQSGATVDIDADMDIGGDVTIEGATILSNTLVVTGTSDLQGDVSDSLGAFTFADNVLVDGQEDVVPLTVQGYTTQTNDLLVLENSSGVDKLTVDNSGNVVVAGTSALQGDTVISGTLVVTSTLDAGGDVTMENDEVLSNATDTVIDVSHFFGFAEQSVVVVTQDCYITPTGSYQPITSTAVITLTTMADGVKNGQLLLLVNENVTDTIMIKDAANTHLSGDITLGNDDTLFLFWDGADWVQITTSDNS